MGNTAVLLGASGLVGGYCLQTLLADPACERIILLTRRELVAVRHPRLMQRIVNFDALTLADFASAEVVYCALGTTMRKAGSKEAFRRVDVDYQLAAAKLGRQAGARQFVLVSAVGADAASNNFYLRTKGELEQEIGELGFAGLHIFRPSLLLGKREEFRLGERLAVVVMPLLNLAMLGGLRRYRAIPAAMVGRAMAIVTRGNKSGTFVYEYDAIRKLAYTRS
jgi:uncharacterized protein YbjT (DUF2867 family)